MRRLPPKYDPKQTQSEGETSDPLIADHRNFYKVDKWTKDGSKVDHMLYAGSSLDKAREVFAEAVKHRPRRRRINNRQFLESVAAPEAPIRCRY
jgi:hypothetical protein